MGIRRAVAFVALGLWALTSTQWGGIPNEAWRLLDQSLIAGAAVVLGCLVGSVRRRSALTYGVLAGITVNAGEILLRPLAGAPPESWIYGRTVDGTVGYHNAQANICAIGICLAVSGMGRARPITRGASGAALGLLLGTLLLTQSRAGLGVGVIAVGVVLVWARSASLVLRLVPAFVVGALLLMPLRTVDAALVTQDPTQISDALHRYCLWAFLAAGVLSASALLAIPSRRLRLGLVVALAAIIGVTLVAGAVVELRSVEPFGGLDLRRLDDSDPNLATAGSTRLLSLSLNGRRDAWRVAWREGRQSPFLGGGQGTFTRAWTEHRRLTELNILQPHSIVLELFSELGIVGLALFVLGISSVAIAVARGPDQLGAAGALGALAAVAGQAAVDWTWSFPALVAPVMLVAGASAAALPRRPPRGVTLVIGSVVLLVALVGLAAPWLAHRDLKAAVQAQSDRPVAALAAIESARRWNRWDPESLEIRGAILERRASRLQLRAISRGPPGSHGCRGSTDFGKRAPPVRAETRPCRDARVPSPMRRTRPSSTSTRRSADDVRWLLPRLRRSSRGSRPSAPMRRSGPAVTSSGTPGVRRRAGGRT